MIFFRRRRMDIELLEHEHKMEMEAASAKFVREKHNWHLDKDREVDHLKRESDLKLKESIVLARLENEQKLKQMELDNKRELEKVKMEYMEQLTQKKSDLIEETYQTLSRSLTKLHEEGNHNSRFTQDLALKMLDSHKIRETHKEIVKLDGE